MSRESETDNWHPPTSTRILSLRPNERAKSHFLKSISMFQTKYKGLGVSLIRNEYSHAWAYLSSNLAAASFAQHSDQSLSGPIRSIQRLVLGVGGEHLTKLPFWETRCRSHLLVKPEKYLPRQPCLCDQNKQHSESQKMLHMYHTDQCKMGLS